MRISLALLGGWLTGVSAVHAESVNLRWDPNPESDVIGYRVYRGTSSRQYDWSQQVGLEPQATAGGLNQGTTYYFAVTALNAGGLESLPSNEVIYEVPAQGPVPDPVASDAAVSTLEDTPVDFVLGASDPDGDPLQYFIVTEPTRGTLSGTPPNLRYTPAPNLHGADSLQFKVSDGQNESAIATVSIQVAAVNDIPVALSRSVSVPEDTPIAILLTASDADGDPLVLSISRAPVGGTLSGTFPTLGYTPRANYFGRDSFAFRVSDGTAFSSTATVSINITAVNDRPVATPGAVTLAEDSSAAIVLSGTDVDTPTLVYAVTRQPGVGTLSGTPPNLAYTPPAGFHGTTSFEFVVNDGSLTSNPATFELVVTPVNAPPTALPATWQVFEDTPKTLTLEGSDPDGDPLTFAITRFPTRGTLVPSGTEWIYRPGSNLSGTDSFEFTCHDGIRTSSPASVTLAVAPVNDAPLAYSQALTISYGQPVSLWLRATDVEGSPLAYRIVTAPTRGTLTGTPPNISYMPDPGFSGDDSFTFVANDGELDSSPARVRLRVSLILISVAGDAAPFASQPASHATDPDPSGGDSASNSDAASTTSDAEAASGDSDPIVEWVSPPLHGAIESGSGGSFTYRSHLDGVPLDAFAYVSRGPGDEVVEGWTSTAVHLVSIDTMRRTESGVSVEFPAIPGPSYAIEVGHQSPWALSEWESGGPFRVDSDRIAGLTLGESPLGAAEFVRLRCTAGDGRNSVASDVWTVFRLPVGPESAGEVFSLPVHGKTRLRANLVATSGDEVSIDVQFDDAVAIHPATRTSTHVLLRLPSGVSDRGGEWWPVTGRSGSALRIDTRGESLDSRLSAGNRVEVRRALTIGDVFGLAGTDGAQLSGGDHLELEDASGGRYSLEYRFTNRGGAGYWVERAGERWGPFRGDELPLLPGQAFRFVRRMQNGVLTLVGKAEGDDFCHYVRPGEHMLGNGHAVAADFGALAEFYFDPLATEAGDSETDIETGLRVGPAKGVWIRIPEASGMVRWNQSRP